MDKITYGVDDQDKRKETHDDTIAEPVLVAKVVVNVLESTQDVLDDLYDAMQEEDHEVVEEGEAASSIRETVLETSPAEWVEDGAVGVYDEEAGVVVSDCNFASGATDLTGDFERELAEMRCVIIENKYGEEEDQIAEIAHAGDEFADILGVRETEESMDGVHCCD